MTVNMNVLATISKEEVMILNKENHKWVLVPKDTIQSIKPHIGKQTYIKTLQENDPFLRVSTTSDNVIFHYAWDNGEVEDLQISNISYQKILANLERDGTLVLLE